MIFVSFFDCLEDLLCFINFSHLSSLWDPYFPYSTEVATQIVTKAHINKQKASIRSSQCNMFFLLCLHIVTM